jgi:hypothetical protein
MTRTSSVLAASRPAADIPALGADTIAGRFSLIAWRSIAIQAQPGLVVYVRSGIVRLREARNARPRVLDTGVSFAAHRGGTIEISAFTNATLDIEWPGMRLERLSPGLEPVAMEPIARAPRP